MARLHGRGAGAWRRDPRDAGRMRGAMARLGCSEARARAVAAYLEKQWEIPKTRLRVSGYGSTRPLCDEANPASSDLGLDECRALNRSTRLAVFGK